LAKISLSEHGGLAAGLRLGRPARVLDSADLPPALRSELDALVSAARRTQAAPAGAGRARDAMSYAVTVEDGDENVLLTGTDTQSSPEFDALVRWLRDHLRSQ
jgi:hypothetical protein